MRSSVSWARAPTVSSTRQSAKSPANLVSETCAQQEALSTFEVAYLVLLNFKINSWLRCRLEEHTTISLCPPLNIFKDFNYSNCDFILCSCHKEVQRVGRR